ncbi:MAG TPA: hypothetical protein VNF04_05325 [Stellaceae bacterium]|nr:hypothetical protein [Stellaceae bacterium]
MYKLAADDLLPDQPAVARRHRSPSRLAVLADAAPGGVPRLFTLSLTLLIAVLWLATRQYQGVVRDGRFYMVQALRALYPDRFAHDLYFLYGSQDQFTLFTRFYAPVVARFGVATSGMAFTVLGQVLWVAGLSYLASGLLRGRVQILLAVAAAIALPSTYALFGYGEEFASPRLFAEALSLGGLGLLVRGRPWPALAAIAAAAALHPLMALPALAVTLVERALVRPAWWLIIGAGVFAVAALAAAGVQPFAALRISLDPTWLAIVAVRDAQCLITAWSSDAYMRVIGTAALAILAMAMAEPRERRFLGCCLAVGLGGLGGTLLGGDLLHNMFVIEIQPWRAMWVLTLAVQLYAVPTLIRLLRRDDRFDLAKLVLATALVLLLVTNWVDPVIFAAAPLMALASGLVLWQMATGRALPATARLLVLGAIAAACTGAVALVPAYVGFVLPWTAKLRMLAESCALVCAAATVIGGWLIAAVRRQRWPAAALTGASLALLAAALWLWDARTPWTRFVEASGPVPASLAALLPEDASVYWEGGVELVWLRLRRPEYYSCAQGTGAVFFRATALEFQRRGEVLRPLRPLDFGKSVLCPRPSDDPGPDDPPRTRADLARVCAADRGLDYLVLARPVDGVAAREWNAPAPYQDERIVHDRLIVTRTSRFYAYSCAALRGDPAGRNRG